MINTDKMCLLVCFISGVILVVAEVSLTYASLSL